MNTSMEKINQDVIIADTSGLISLFSPTDHNHKVAVEAAKRLSHDHKDILIPAAVMVEFLNILGRKAGHAAALRTDAETSDAVRWNEQGKVPSVYRNQMHHLFPRLS